LLIDEPPYFTFPKTWIPIRTAVLCCVHYVGKKAAQTYVVGEGSIKEGNSITNALMLDNDSNRGDRVTYCSDLSSSGISIRYGCACPGFSVPSDMPPSS
jgi:hypothetical protein